MQASFPHNILQPVSPIGLMVPVTAGLALATKVRTVRSGWPSIGSATAAPRRRRPTKGLNFAAVQKLPAIFIIQNNQVALGTRVDQHHLGGNLNALPASYGVQGWAFDGNNVLDAYAATQLAVDVIHDGEAPSCWWPIPSEWAVTPRTMSAKRAILSRRSFSIIGAGEIPSGFTKNI